jgi:alanine racemase
MDINLSASLRPTVVEVDLKGLADNYKSISLFTNTKIMPILKANAYGHGLVEVARTLEACGADCLGVAFLEEAVSLREAGIRSPILALGGVSGRQIETFLNYEIQITASSADKLELIDVLAGQLKKIAHVHLKIDTGIERIGAHYYSADKLLEKAIACKNVKVEGVFSHFAMSETNLEFTKLQLERFLEAVSFFEKRSLPTPTRHIANSGGILGLKESHLDLVRPGLLLYGYCSSDYSQQKMEVRPCFSLKSEVVYFKVVRQGSGVSYNHTWTAKEQTRVVTVPIGYGDGYPRSLSNKSSVIIRGKKLPTIGTICMDQLMVDLGQSGTAYNGDEVVLIGNQEGEKICLLELANLANLDPRELLVMLNTRIPRTFSVGELGL